MKLSKAGDSVNALPSLQNAITRLSYAPLSEQTLDDHLAAAVINIALGDRYGGAITSLAAVFEVEVWSGRDERSRFLTQADYAAISRTAESTFAMWSARFRSLTPPLLRAVEGLRINRTPRLRYVPTTSFITALTSVRNHYGLAGDSGIVAAIAIRMSERKATFAEIGTPAVLAGLMGFEGANAERTVRTRVESLIREDANILTSLGDGSFTLAGPQWSALAPSRTSSEVWRRAPVPRLAPAARQAPIARDATPVRERPVRGGATGAIDNSYIYTGNSVTDGSRTEPTLASLSFSEQKAEALGSSPSRANSSSSSGAAAARACAENAADTRRRGDDATPRLTRFGFVERVQSAIDDRGQMSWASAIDLFRHAIACVPGHIQRVSDDDICAALAPQFEAWRAAGLSACDLFEAIYDRSGWQVANNRSVTSVAWLAWILPDQMREAADRAAVANQTVSSRHPPRLEIATEAGDGDAEASGWDTENMSSAMLAIAMLLDDRPVVPDDEQTQAWYLAKIEDVMLQAGFRSKWIPGNNITRPAVAVSDGAAPSTPERDIAPRSQEPSHERM